MMMAKMITLMMTALTLDQRRHCSTFIVSLSLSLIHSVFFLSLCFADWIGFRECLSRKVRNLKTEPIVAVKEGGEKTPSISDDQKWRSPWIVSFSGKDSLALLLPGYDEWSLVLKLFFLPKSVKLIRKTMKSHCSFILPNGASSLHCFSWRSLSSFLGSLKRLLLLNFALFASILLFV